jgi:hypothetical protein
MRQVVKHAIPRCSFFFLSRQSILDQPPGSSPPCLQELLDAGWLRDGRLVRKDIYHDAAFRALYKDEYCAVSHRWEEKHRPDGQGVQLTALQVFLRQQPNIKWVWYDFWCLCPAMPRTGVVLARAPQIKSSRMRRASL